MSPKQKTVLYNTTKPYSTLNTITKKTKNIWMVFHGMGYLSRYFLKPFLALDPEENYIISPQAPSKYYLDDQFKYVGASWLTREDRDLELQNALAYVDGVFENEAIPENVNLILFGFSQGVSIVTRWMSLRKINCSSLLLYAGSIPNELSATDFDFMDFETTSVKIIFGNQDKYLTEERVQLENKKINLIFKGNATTVTYEGGHEINSKVLLGLI